MAVLTADMENFNFGTQNYNFSGTKIAELSASEYTLVTIVLDESGSTSSFAAELEKAVGEVVKSCRKSPRKDNLMLRLVNFGSKVREVHGFKLLETCQEADYVGIYGSGGNTALYDSCYDAVQATTEYAKNLRNSDFACNAVIFVLTDGADNVSAFNSAKVGTAIREAVQGEALENIQIVLIGIDTDAALVSYLDKFATEAGFTPVVTGGVTKNFVSLTDTNPGTLAKLAKFVSKSISSSSQSLGSAQPQSLTF